jgi:hypothetical protein
VWLFALLVLGGCGAVEPVQWSELRSPRRLREQPSVADDVEDQRVAQAQTQAEVRSERTEERQRASERRRASRRQEPEGYRVAPANGRNVADVSVDDVIHLMRRVQFSDDEIIELGPGLREALRQYGGAKITDGADAVVSFLVSGTAILVESDGRGSYVYDMTRGRFSLILPPSFSKR